MSPGGGVENSWMQGDMGMKRNNRFSFLRLGGQRGVTAEASPDSVPGAVRLKGADLEQAYRHLLLENQVLAESNQRLHERIARQESGLEESPAARQLIRTQRNALAERSHKLRELAYENKLIKRERDKLAAENRRLAAGNAQQASRLRSMEGEVQSVRAALDEAKAELRIKKNELAMLTDRHYQLAAQMEGRLRTGIAANSDF
jgi:dynactin complex subunit